MPRFFDAVREFAGGLVTGTKSDRVPASTTPRAKNSYLLGVEGTAVPAKRRGLTTVNQTNGTVAGAGTESVVIAQVQYKKLVGASFTRYHFWVDDDGRCGTIASDPGGTGAVTSVGGTSTFVGTVVPDFAQAANLLFTVDGTKKLKFDGGAAMQNFGITRPDDVPTLAAGGAGTPSGTYEARVTYYNEDTGHESSASDTSSSVAVSSQEIDFTDVPVSGDSQVTHRRIYLRNTSTMSNFYLGVTIADNSTTTATFNAADSTLITLGPDTAENDPPPAATTLAWHRSRMFVADDSKIYYSKVGLPEAFDPDNFERVNPQDGQKITAVRSMGDILLIFKERSLYGLFGIDPDTWVIRLISPDLGTYTFQSITFYKNNIAWWSHQGPVGMSANGEPELLGVPIRESLTSSVIQFANLDGICAATDPERYHLLWAVTDAADNDTHSMIYVFNYDLKSWVGIWDPMHIASLAQVVDDDGRAWVYLGNTYGQIFRFWDADNDGIPGGTSSGSWTAAGTSTTSITSTGFYTTGKGVAGRYVRLEASDGTLMGKAIVGSNTGTTLTLVTAITGLTNGTSYTFYVGGPAFEWDTRDEDSGAPFHKKRYEYLHIQSEDTSATIYIDLYVSFADAVKRTFSYSTSSSTHTVVTKRFRAAATGTAWRVRVRNRVPDAPVTLYEIAMTGETQTTKIG